ncbi:hypothetical protein TIFTF001_000081 [Ficus carica]|uniref:Uncharacterized protein n=1 Tax=Ficus carica TaxID=3494 RepID=A0AA87ZBU4_FICCA|nr:hypothetical protein TIFTF001_000081 [Ficus carica]
MAPWGGWSGYAPPPWGCMGRPIVFVQPSERRVGSCHYRMGIGSPSTP